MEYPKEPKQGERITAAWAVSVVRWIRRLATLLNVDGSSGLEIVGGTLRAVRDPAGAILVRTPSGGIPARSGTVPGTATVTLYQFDGTDLTLTAETATIRNHLAVSWDGNRDVWAVPWAGALWPAVQACAS